MFCPECNEVHPYCNECYEEGKRTGKVKDVNYKITDTSPQLDERLK